MENSKTIVIFKFLFLYRYQNITNYAWSNFLISKGWFVCTVSCKFIEHYTFYIGKDFFKLLFYNSAQHG